MIKNILNKLTPEDRQMLILAFNTGICRSVEFEGGVIGVNLCKDNLDVIEESGDWVSARVRKKEGLELSGG